MPGLIQTRMATIRKVSIPCPHCSVRAKAPVDKVTAKGLKYNCPNCKTTIIATKTEKGISVRRAKADELEKSEEPTAKKEKKQLVVQGAPMWIVTFADLATLLLTFFVLMLSFANMDIVKFQDLMGSVRERYGVTMLERGDFQAVSEGRLEEVDSNVKQSSEMVAREKLVNVIYDSVIRAGFKGSTSITSTDEGVRVRVKGRALFKPGQATLVPSSEKFIDEISNVIKTTKNLYMVVEGHTDNRPIRTKKFPSNWELSVLRASAVLEKLLDKDVPPKKISAAGYADARPLFSNDREETRPLNRRVEFLFKRG